MCPKVREAELISQLDHVIQEKLKSLSVQKDQIETVLAQLCSCQLFMRESLREGNEENSLLMKPNTVERVKELSTSFPPEFLQPNTEADLIFSPDDSHQCVKVMDRS